MRTRTLPLFAWLFCATARAVSGVDTTLDAYDQCMHSIVMGDHLKISYVTRQVEGRLVAIRSGTEPWEATRKFLVRERGANWLFEGDAINQAVRSPRTPKPQLKLLREPAAPSLVAVAFTMRNRQDILMSVDLTSSAHHGSPVTEIQGTRVTDEAFLATLREGMLASVRDDLAYGNRLAGAAAEAAAASDKLPSHGEGSMWTPIFRSAASWLVKVATHVSPRKWDKCRAIPDPAFQAELASLIGKP